MKVVGVMATHQRPKITTATLQMLGKQTLPFHQIVVAGDSAVDKKCVESVGCDYITVPNFPLGRKYQCALAWAKTYDPDAVVILGSDTWLSTKWVEVCADIMATGIELVGRADWHTLKVAPGEQPELYHRKYRTRVDPVGGGRMIASALLYRIDWDFFPITFNSCLDSESFSRVVGAVKTKTTEDTAVLGIKGPWPTINRLGEVQDTEGVEVLRTWEAGDVCGWLETNFPGGCDLLDLVVEDIKWGDREVR